MLIMTIFIQKSFLQTKSMSEFSDMKSKNVTNDQNAPTDSELETHILNKFGLIYSVPYFVPKILDEI